MVSAVRPSTKKVAFSPTSSRTSSRIPSPLSAEDQRGDVPDPLSRDPAATLPGRGTFTSLSMSTEK
jgi:hypothetical protein